MDLRRRLAALDRTTRKPEPAAVGPRDVHEREAALRGLGLEQRSTPAGPVWCRDVRDEVPAPAAGPVPDLSGFFTRSGNLGPPVRDLLLLDTETTGLAGGTGTLPFLVGLSWWEGGGLVTRQLFLPDPGGEPALLWALAERARGVAAVLTYNGASFDLPLLRTRALLNRRDDPLAEAASWDLLVPARRLWSRCLPDCRQQTVEREVCGRERGEGDIDGALIPQTWFDFVAGGGAGDMERVLRHNRRDMVGMALIWNEILAAAGLEPPARRSWREAWSLGRIAERRCDNPAAADWMRQAAAEGLGGEPALIRDAVRILKRTADWDEVERLLVGALATEPDDPWLHTELAKVCEHRRRDYGRALEHAKLAGDDHRMARLERRLSVSAANGREAEES